MGNFIDMTGLKFGRLTVIRRGKNYYSPIGKPVTTWVCRCECGNIITVFGNNLRSGATQSCGCIRRKVNRPPKTASVPHYAPPIQPTIQDALIIGETYTIKDKPLKCIGLYEEYARFEDDNGFHDCFRFWDLEREMKHDL